MKPKTAIATLVIFIISSSSLWSKNEDWQITLANGDMISHVSLQRLEDDSLVVSSLSETSSDAQSFKWIPVESIIELRQIKYSKFRKGAEIGCLCGAAAGIVFGTGAGLSVFEEDEDIDILQVSEGALVMGIFGGLAGSVLGGLVGLVGSTAGKDEVYALSRMDHETKLKTIQRILSKDSAKYW